MFVPSFLWIFLGGPYVEALIGNKALNATLSAVTGAVVGVILNLAVWFAMHSLFSQVQDVRSLGLSVGVPVWSTINLPALAIMIAATVANPDWGFSRLLETKILRWVGSLSYSLYLWQQIFLNPTLVNHRYVILQTVARVAMAFICAYLSYRIIEKPAIRLGHRLAPPATPGRGDLDSRSRSAVPAETAVAAAEHS